VGSVNLAEFFVTVSESITFFLTIGFLHWKIILGLMLGGVVAAPLAALITKKLPVKPFMVLVGAVIIFLSVRNLYLYLR